MVKSILRKFLILLIIFVCFSCSNNVKIIEEQSLEVRNYVLNKSSKRVHSETCGTGQSTKIKNKEIVKTSLNSLLEKGYKACGLCNAGIKENGTIFFPFFNNAILSTESKYDFEYPTKEEYINSIMKMGEWYVNHIPTYCRDLQIMDDIDYIKTNKIFKGYILYNKKKQKTQNYLVVSTSSDAIKIKNINKDVLVARESAVKYY